MRSRNTRHGYVPRYLIKVGEEPERGKLSAGADDPCCHIRALDALVRKRIDISESFPPSRLPVDGQIEASLNNDAKS